MTEIEAIRQRHSVRSYQQKNIDPDTVGKLRDKIAALNKAGNLHLQLIEDAGDTFNRILSRVMGLGSAPSVIACVGKDGTDLEERIGYYGQQLVLYAQTLGLNTCWAGTFNKKKVPAELAPDERLVIVIAIGYGVDSGRVRKSKTPDQVTRGDKHPKWFDFGVEMALLAPTAVNQQKFEISFNGEEAVFQDMGGIFSKVDLGIVRYHFDVGAAFAKNS